jgi:hypothetical protein
MPGVRRTRAADSAIPGRPPGSLGRCRRSAFINGGSGKALITRGSEGVTVVTATTGSSRFDDKNPRLCRTTPNRRPGHPVGSVGRRHAPASAAKILCRIAINYVSLVSNRGQQPARQTRRVAWCHTPPLFAIQYSNPPISGSRRWTDVPDGPGARHPLYICFLIYKFSIRYRTYPGRDERTVT